MVTPKNSFYINHRNIDKHCICIIMQCISRYNVFDLTLQCILYHRLLQTCDWHLCYAETLVQEKADLECVGQFLHQTS